MVLICRLPYWLPQKLSVRGAGIAKMFLLNVLLFPQREYFVLDLYEDRFSFGSIVCTKGYSSILITEALFYEMEHQRLNYAFPNDGISAAVTGYQHKHVITGEPEGITPAIGGLQKMVLDEIQFGTSNKLINFFHNYKKEAKLKKWFFITMHKEP